MMRGSFTLLAISPPSMPETSSTPNSSGKLSSNGSVGRKPRFMDKVEWREPALGIGREQKFLPGHHRARLRLRRHALAAADAGAHGAAEDRRGARAILGDGESRGERHRDRPYAVGHAPHRRGAGRREQE